MSGSAPTNNQAVDFEKQQAAEADAKEAARQARLTQGQTLIDQIFNGQPVMGTKTSNYDWSTFNPTAYNQATSSAQQAAGNRTATAPAGSGGVPEGYSLVQVAPKASTTGAAASRYSGGTPQATTTSQSIGSRWGDQSVTTPGAGSQSSRAANVWALKGPDGQIHYQGDPLSITSQYDTGQKTGGFDDDFYNAYKQKILDYYNPDEQRQYDEASRDLKYSLARAGTLQSSTAADKQGELGYQDALQKANIVANANTQEGNLKSQIQSNKQSLINQLYSTEDPTLTANLAESSANATRLQDPNLTPAAALFTPALTTVGSAISGMMYPGQTYNSPFNTAGSSPTPSPANDSRGKVIGT